ncbi:MAG: MipA/OmpV family protein [Hyphomicrobium sp.]|nr:MipA/OmpV family protein [Hyphomicrobium sp.]
MRISAVPYTLCLSVFVAYANSASANDAIDLQIGGAAVIAPKYEGSKDYEVRGFPILAPAGSATGDDGVVQVRGVDDFRWRAINFNGFEAGPLAGYRFSRDESDGDRLDGLGDIDGGIVVGAYAAYNFNFMKPFVSYHYAVTGDDTGGLLRFGAETRVPVTSAIAITAVAGATYADSNYTDAYFGISAEQSTNSVAGLSQFDADAGIKDVYFNLSTAIPLTEVWSLKLAGRYSHLLGDAADSPIVETESQFSGVVGLTYRFSVDR